MGYIWSYNTSEERKTIRTNKEEIKEEIFVQEKLIPKKEVDLGVLKKRKGSHKSEEHLKLPP